MSTTISDEELNRIWVAWRPYGVHSKAQDKTTKLILVVQDKISQMISLVKHSDVSVALQLLDKSKDTVTNSFLMCYYLGYEFAAKNISGADGTPYLMAATESIEELVLLIFGVLVAKEILAEDPARKMGLEISKLTGETANDICILGIENFGKIGYR